MKWMYSYVLIVFCFKFGRVFGNYTFTDDMATKCKVHFARGGYNYETFYAVDILDRYKDSNNAFEMHIAILAASNGHILLSHTERPGILDPVYEIVIGGGGNKFTELRRNLRRNAVKTVKTISVLSAIEYKAFYIKIDKDGEFEFGAEGDKLPIISYFDTSPISINFFSFTSWNGVEAKFLYDCPIFDGNTTKASPSKSKEVEKKLSPSDNLRKTLLKDRPANLPPGPEVTVKFYFDFISTKFDASNLKADIRLAFVLSWTDEGLAWNPDKFNGTTHLTFRQGQIWTPKFMVTNSANAGPLDIPNPESIYFKSDGTAVFHFQTTISCWCSEENSIFNSWPRDKYQCVIEITAWDTHEGILLEPLDEENRMVKMFLPLDQQMATNWEYVSNKSMISANMSLFADKVGNSELLETEVIIMRRDSTYKIVFYTPLLAFVTFLLMSFWSPSLEMSRVWFYIVSLSILCMGLCFVDYLVPCQTIPSLLILYVFILFGTMVALMVQVFLMSPLTQNIIKSRYVEVFLQAKIVRNIFCLGSNKTNNIYESVNEIYFGNDDEERVPAPTRNEVEEMENEKQGPTEKEELANVLDKTMFFALSIIIAILLNLHF